MDEWVWEERAFGNKGEGQDFSRADVLGYAVWTWPANEKVRAWLENWERWEQEEPAFFTEKWRKRVSSSAPREALPPALKRKFDTANENKERYLRSSSSLSRSRSLAVSDDDAGGRSAGASAKVAPTS